MTKGLIRSLASISGLNLISEADRDTLRRNKDEEQRRWLPNIKQGRKYSTEVRSYFLQQQKGRR